MIYILIALILSTHHAASGASVIRIHRENLITQITYFTGSYDQWYTGTAVFDFLSATSFQVDPENIYPLADYYIARGVVIGPWTSGNYVEFDSPRLYLSETFIAGVNIGAFAPLMYIGAGPNTSFINTFPSIIISAQTEAEYYEMILNPRDPSEYAFSGELFYAPLVEQQTGHSFWAVNTTIYFGRDNEDYPNHSTYDSSLCMFSIEKPRDSIHVPPHVISRFIEIATSQGIHIQRSSSNNITLHNITEGSLFSLPNLNYLINRDEGFIHIATLEPSDYIRFAAPGQIEAQLLLVDSAPNMCLFDPKIVDGLAIHLDTANNRIGFGDAI